MTSPPPRPADGAPRTHPALAPPPPDVQHLLDSQGAGLQLYFDSQRAAALLRAQHDWPRLWRLAPAPE